MVTSGDVAWRRPARLRLTRRGRLVVLVLLLLTNTVAGVLLATASRAAAPQGPPPAVVVAPRDTLWSIAARHAPDRAVPEVVAEIRELNGLTANEIHPGDRLVLPRG